MSIPSIKGQSAVVVDYPQKDYKEISGAEKFLWNLPRNSFLAFLTTPGERLGVGRILILLNDPSRVPSSYIKVIKKLGLKGLFFGSVSRVSYVLAGNFATVVGMGVFGEDFKGMLLTSIAKNAILPLSQLSNARQMNMNWCETKTFVRNGCLDVGGHWSFFWRNLLSNYCIIPGFYVRDRIYQEQEEKNALVANGAGLAVSGVISSVMNTALKPFYTGKFPPEVRRAVAKKGLPGFIPILFRETTSLSLVFASSTPKLQSRE